MSAVKKQILEVRRKIPFIKKYFEGKTFNMEDAFGVYELEIMKVGLFADVVFVNYIGPNYNENQLVQQCKDKIENYFNVIVTMNWRGEYHP